MLSRLKFPSPLMSTSIITRSIRQSENLRSQKRLPFAGNIPPRTIKEKLLAPPGPNAYGIGQGALIGGSVLGLGALCIFALGISGNKTSIMNESMIWPPYVRQRIHDTYKYLGGSIIITAASAAAVFRTPALLSLSARTGWVSFLAALALMMGSGITAQSIQYKRGFGAKQIAWAAHCAIMGAVLAPLSFVGGTIMIRAAWLTAGVTGGLSALAVCAPSDRFLNIGGPLAIGLGVVFASLIGSIFLPPTTAVGVGLHSMSLYGGLLLFSAYLLYDTQRIVYKAKSHPVIGYKEFDPINQSISVFMNILNIFIRIVSILAGQGSRRDK